jgi:hypothetical protein
VYKLEITWVHRLKFKCDDQLSSFASNYNLRCYSWDNMFEGAAVFDQDITKWAASGSTTDMFKNATRWLLKHKREVDVNSVDGLASAWEPIPIVG